MKELLQSETLAAAVKGALGMGATSTGVYVSILPRVEAWLRLISLCVGIAVGAATFLSIVLSIRRRNAAARDNERSD
jgi:hypothetical protein